MISYGDRVIVTGMDPNICISTLLYASDLGRQTSVLCINQDRKTGLRLKARYVWEHTNKRPNTHTYPFACPKCNHIRSWSEVTRTNGNPFELKCQGRVLKSGGGTVRCCGTYAIGPRPLTTPVNSPYIGRWLTCTE